MFDLLGSETDTDVDLHSVQLGIFTDRFRYAQFHVVLGSHFRRYDDWIQRPVCTNFREFHFALLRVKIADFFGRFFNVRLLT